MSPRPSVPLAALLALTAFGWPREREIEIRAGLTWSFSVE